MREKLARLESRLSQPTELEPVRIAKPSRRSGAFLVGDQVRYLVRSQYRPPARAVEVRAGHRIPVLNVAQRNVAAMAEKPPNALSARSVLFRAARVIMVHVDELLVLKRLVTHAAGVVLRLQKQVEQLLGQPVARNPVLPVGLLAGLR
jgi:hypothetical protein